MGASVSTSVTKIVQESMISQQSKVVSEAFTTNNQSIVIDVQNTTGNVNISGNTMEQTGTVNTSTSLAALNESSINQEMISQIQQEIKSEISGINLFNVSTTSNTFDLCMKASIEVSTTTIMTCGTTSNQDMIISVNNTDGNVDITNNSMKQMSNITSDCVQNAASKNSTMQKLDENVENNQSSETSGVSPLAIAILIMSVAFFLPVAAKNAGKAVLSLIFPVCLIFGIINLIKWITHVTTVVNSHPFSKLIEHAGGSCLNFKVHSTNTSFTNVAQAEEYARTTGGIEAYDFKCMSLNNIGEHTYINPFVSTFYSNVDSKCEKYLVDNPDNTKTTKKPIMVEGSSAPGSTVGDAFLNIKTAEYYYFNYDTSTWSKQGKFVEVLGSTNEIHWGPIDPIATDLASNLNNYYVNYFEDHPSEFILYVKEENGWKLTGDKFTGPGPSVNCPTDLNCSGFVKQTRSFALFITSVALIAVGAIGMNRQKKKNKKKKSGK
jgi:hypothetical protein